MGTTADPFYSSTCTAVAFPSGDALKDEVTSWKRDQTESEGRTGPIADWNVEKVTTMERIFYNAGVFNGAIGSWDVGEVTDMCGAFYGAAAFNEDISSWDVGEVTNTNSMFKAADALNDCSKKALADGWGGNNVFMARYGNPWKTLPCA